MEGRLLRGAGAALVALSVVAAGCDAGGGSGANAGLGGAGESCTKTADCEAGLKCVELVCVVDTSAGGSDTSGGDGTVAPPASGYILVQPGVFTMGSPSDESGRDDDEMQHPVTLTHSFWLKATEVTQGEWESLMGGNPSSFGSCGADCPVEDVSWYDAVGYCNALSAQQGLAKCYEVDGYAVTFAGLDCPGYRFPTEAEWEYAARAGTTGARYGDLDAVAWYDSNSGGKPHPVGKKQANAWGLYDMLGNVWEWCHDWYVDDAAGPATDPSGPSVGSNRVLRGGSWISDAVFARAASRNCYSPGFRNFYLGLRPARSNP